jgi:phosphoribosylaminoimidazolecarboxamide formyltransferase/IMP cyclohydrolase
VRIQRALISVSDKRGVVEFARGLSELGVEILSTGGTARALEAAGVPVTPVERVTGFPEMMDGRVKTLHPAIHGGILADRDRPEHLEALEAAGFRPIDLVAVNLYPFRSTVDRSDCTTDEAIENIDIGGPSMVRSAAKNHRSVTVITSPDDYAAVLAEVREHDGCTLPETRARLARAAFAHTAEYDAAIAAYLAGMPARLTLDLAKSADLRYGENPHQPAAIYRDPAVREPCVAGARQLHGKDLSFINYLDLDAALELVKEFDDPACAIIKHTNPCGVGVAPSPAEAYRKARDGELPPFNPPGSRFGGIIALNRPVDEETARAIVEPKSFYECVIAPGYAPGALDLLRNRQGWGAALRILQIEPIPPRVEWSSGHGRDALDLKKIVGGHLLQRRDLRDPRDEELRVVTRRSPTEAEWADLRFAWKVVRHVKSNAVVLACGGQLIGLGAGQTNRALSSFLAVRMAEHRSRGAVCASDAFFPMPDGPRELAEAGVTAIIQPGGSRKDDDVVAVCDEHGMAMVFTGLRHFRH